jgi:hypothetical protein
MGLRRDIAKRTAGAVSLAITGMLLATLLSFSTAPAGAEDVIHPLTFGSAVVLPKSGTTGSQSTTCYNPCGEPSMAVAPDNTVYVSTPRTLLLCCNSLSSPVWKSADGGKTWGNPIFPAAPAAQANAFTGGDTELAVDKRGTVYEGELWLGSDSMYYSSDKGATWNWSPVSHDVLDDREWIVYSEKDDSLYGVYDGFKGIMFVRVPLNTPLGADAARFAPIERVMVPIYPDCPAIVAGPCVQKPSAVPDEINGTPLLAGATSPGRPAVDQTSGTVYFPLPFQTAGRGILIASTADGGQSFQYHYVTGAGGGTFGDTGNDFPVTAVDTAGNLYVAWSEHRADGFQVYVAGSRDHGATWTTPTVVSSGVTGTAIFPNIVAGAPGRVAVSWFGTADVGDPNELVNSTWGVHASMSLNALDAAPAFEHVVVQANTHKGAICTHGLGCVGDSRKLLDFFDMQLDRSNGALMIVYARDKGGKLGGAGTDIAFNRQSEGCSLTQPGVAIGAGQPGTPPTVC